MAFTEPALIDAFGRVNENPLANGTWLGETWPGDAEGRTNATGGAHSAGAGFGGSHIASIARDQKISCTAVTVPANQQVLLYARLVDPGLSTLDGYYVAFRKTNNDVRLFKITNASTVILATWSHVLADGDKLGFELNGDTLSAHADSGSGFVEVGMFQDTVAPIYSNAGSVGFEVSASTVVIDDYRAAAIGGASGQDQARMTISGTLAQVNMALATLDLDPKTDYLGGVTVTMTSRTSTPLSDTDMFNVEVVEPPPPSLDQTRLTRARRRRR